MPTYRLPAPLSQRIRSVTTNIYSRQGREYDVAIGGVPFRLATSPETPHTIETIPIRKDQVDTEQDPGEQSLAGWWRRAQASFHEGAGFLYQENSEQLVPGLGYWDSRGVDVFTKGQISLIKKMVENDSGIYSRVRPAASGVVVMSAIESGDIVTFGDVDGAATVLLAGSYNDAIVTGNTFYAVEADTLTAGFVSSPGTADTWPLTSDGGVNLIFGKHRLWVYGANVLYQPDLSLAAATNQDAIFEHPSTGFSYTSATEGPAAMYFAGDDGVTANIQAITLDSDGGLPTLSGATVVTTLPEGERIYSIAALGGTFMGIGTSVGFRVARINADASITYGPVLMEGDAYNVSTQGRFFVVSLVTDDGAANTPLAYRVDTGTELDELVYPYAPDIEASSGDYFSSVASIDGRLVGTVADVGGGGVSLWYQSDTDYVDSGWLQSGRVRFRTTEKKFFRSLSVEIEPLEGAISIDLIREGGSTQPLGNITTQGAVRNDPFLIGGEPLRHGSVKFTLTPESSTATPVLNSYQLTSYPAVTPQRLHTLPLLCFDIEQSHSGHQYGGQGFSVDRLLALQTIENEQELVTFQDFTFGSTSGQLVLIERVRFVQTSPATTPNGVTGPGGILIVELRTVEGT